MGGARSPISCFKNRGVVSSDVQSPLGEKSVQLFPAQLAGDKRYDLLIEMKLKGTAAMEATLRPPFGSQRNL